MTHNWEWIEGFRADLMRQGLWRGRRSVVSLPDGWCNIGGRRLRNFAGNDYLGLAHDPRIVVAMADAVINYGAGVTASALVSGRSPVHVELERALAQFMGQASTVVFPTGYAANLGTVASLMNSEDVVYCDRLNHACLVDGCRLSGAKLRVYRHQELDRLHSELAKSASARRRWIVTDSVFSMDGDVAPLEELCDLAESHSVGIILDEAHGFGILGPNGRGAAEWKGVESRVAVTIGTLSKSVGALGGFVSGPEILTEWLWNRARTQMFSTALPVPVCVAAIKSLEIMKNEPWRRDKVIKMAEQLRSQLRGQGFEVPSGVGPIVPVILGEPSQTLDAAAWLECRGFFVAAIRPPTVPEGTCRLRLTITADTTTEDLAGICEHLTQFRNGCSHSSSG